jgi:putative GTP pyrophosphokinase
MVNREDLKESYSLRYNRFLQPLEKGLQEYVAGLVADYPRVDRVTARAKSLDSFVKKAQRKESGCFKYSDPLNQIQDQLGARIVVFYLSDVDNMSALVKGYFRSIEERRIVPDSPDRFGYEGKHFILFIPDDVLDEESARSTHFFPFFELQINTLFQHSWGEAAHGLSYKPPAKLTTLQQRQVAFTGAQAWGADMIFNQLAKELLPPNHSGS